MSRILKIVIWIVVILVVLGVLGYLWAKSVWDKISFSPPRLQSLDLQGLTIEDLVNIAFTGSQKEVIVTLGMDIKNANSFSIPFGKMKVKLYHNDTLIAATSPVLSAQKFKLAPNSTTSISDTVNIILNNAGGQMLIEKIKGGSPKIDYEVGLSLYGIPLPSIKNSFAW